MADPGAMAFEQSRSFHPAKRISLWPAWTALKLPNFDADLLFLMGISFSVYLGFKAPKKSS